VLKNWFIMLPEICILSFLIWAKVIEMFKKEKTSKTYFAMAQFFLLATISATVLFYNKSVYPELWQNTALTSLFKIFVYLLAWAWFYLSSKWFLNKNRPSFKFYCICFALLFCFDLLASASSLLTLMLVVPAICLLNYMLILRHWDIEKMAPIARRYAISSILFCALLASGSFILYKVSGSFEYVAIQKFLQNMPQLSAVVFGAVIMVVAAFLFLMALAPFHNWFVETVANSVLPVCGFITLVPLLVYYCAIINLMSNAFAPIAEKLSILFFVLAAISLAIGALAANNENNLRRLFAFLTVYGNGFAFVGLLGFGQQDLIASFAYNIVFVLSMTGIYTVFLGLKSKGEYLTDLSVLSGFYATRPYMSAGLLVFMFSLMGIAPTLGFLGYLSVFNSLATTNNWIIIGWLFGGILFATAAILQIVRTIYFEQPTIKFDRPDKSIYICLFINVLLVLLLLINPAWLLQDAIVILGGM